MDKIHAMQLFIRVAELESFSRAAETLGLPKGSVSRQIQALENHLGSRLLHRTTRRVLLTQDGMVYFERAKDLLSNLEELDSLFQTDPSSVSGRLRVDMPVAIARNVVIPRLPDFLQHYPGIELELSSSDRLVDVIREGFDCVVRVGALKDSGLIARPLGKLTVINCASPSYLARFGYPESLEDLSSHALVHYAVNLGMRPQGFEVARDNGSQWVKTGGVLTVNSTETYHAACLAGLGIIQVPRVGVREALHGGKLIEILPQYRAEPMPVSLLYPHRRNLSRRVHLLMEWLTEVLRDYVD
ncbi:MULTISPECIES: LysR family transcriptional regulator [unclassified Klebsiella]|uniref:LysR family transcriptional regulator n=1 Tax=Enterobacteriaceae TaxID=543 RepID=UPI0015DC8616|nr:MULTISPECIES: LysR family transcriptional regulator [unclassified Klebsiella]HAT3955293.1 LysR family transcriptional regulator [Kluyvera ascorbata]BBR56913.1 LysR family transcriptional regulator [Klebsiella sp. WP4-W18-ESBL-05]BBS89676.1 LysR family transcriptional regulator [Klebsiella sp. WP7-S18-CRE-02]BBS94698.1 LysR family transcriptional regulator [Klebsiella sp. WP7-S18-CRE-03]BBS99729.1 LysR family transcriptional regulator [Klebsiella sp. WP7-S18-ESBL-04]